MKYICEKCKKSFDRKSTYVNHLNRKISCVKEIEYIKKRKCLYCKQIFSRCYHANKHMTTCKSKQYENNELKQIIIDLKKELTDKLTKIENKPTTIINNNCNNKNSINIQQNIILPYGKEELDHLTDNDYKRIFNKGCYAVPELIKAVYCNKDKPQNMNIFVKNLTNEYLLVYNGQEWDVKKEDIIHNMIETKKYLLECKYED